MAVLLIVAVLSLMLGGCAINSYKNSGAELAVEVLPVEAASVLKAHARVDDGVLIIFGKVRKSHEFKKAGHVHIEVRKPDGTLVGVDITPMVTVVAVSWLYIEPSAVVSFSHLLSAASHLKVS